MRLEKISLIIAIVCTIVVLAVPFFRGFATTQIRIINPMCEKSIWTGDPDPTILIHNPKTDAQLLKENPNDFLLRLALVQELFDKIDFGYTEDSSEAANISRARQEINKLMRDYPREGVVYSVAMRLPEYANGCTPSRIEGNGVIVPEDIARNWKNPRPPTKELIDYTQRYLNLLDKATAADPDNGWFHYIKAYYLHSLHRDTEARSELHLSAAAPYFTDYDDLKVKSMNHVFDLRGGFNPMDRISINSKMTFISSLAYMREEARIAGNLAYKEIQSGNTDQGIRAALDITNSGYNMTKNATLYIHAMVGNAIINIGASTFDPTFKPDKKISKEAQQAARLTHYKQFLIKSGYPKEATALETQWKQVERCQKNLKKHAGGLWGDEYGAMTHFTWVFIATISIFIIIILFAATWAIASLLTIRGGARGFWDKRAAVTFALLSALVLVPVITDLVIPSGIPDFSAVFNGGPASELMSPLFLLIPLSIIVIAMLAGLIVMMKRTPKDGENRHMPVSALLTAYLAVVGGLAYLTYGIEDFTESSSFFESLQNISYVLLIFWPIAAMIIYALLRAMQSRFGRVRRSAPLTFIATIRYASAVAVGMFSIAYLCMAMLTAHYGVKADAYAKDYYKKEIAIIRSAFK